MPLSTSQAINKLVMIGIVKLSQTNQVVKIEFVNIVELSLTINCENLVMKIDNCNEQ